MKKSPTETSSHPETLTGAEVLTAALAYDSTTRRHLERVRRYALTLAQAVGVADEAHLPAIVEAGLFPAVGKLAPPQRLPKKPARMTDRGFPPSKHTCRCVGAN